MIAIDGSLLEGGGQVLRTALSLSVLLQTPFSIERIRYSRPNPGLAGQHLTAVNACAEISRARLSGNELGSQRLSFSPGGIYPGKYSFDVSSAHPSAGSAILVLQTILPPLLFAGAKSEVSIAGGTHVPWSPCFDYAEKAFLPALARMGANASVSLQRRGFYPAGGGKISAEILTASGPLEPFSLLERGRLESVSGVSVASSLPAHIALRQKSAALAALASLPCAKEISVESGESPCPGTFAFLQAGYSRASACFSSLGAKGKPAETVGAEAANALLAFDSSGASVDEHLADQLLLYCALAEGESEFTVAQASDHLRSNAEVIRLFLPRAKVGLDGARVRVSGASLAH